MGYLCQATTSRPPKFHKIDEVMKHFGIYLSVLLLGTACANQGQLAQFDDDGIYARPADSRSGGATTQDAYHFLGEDQGASGSSAGYLGSDRSADGDIWAANGDDYVPEARSMPSEDGRAYSNSRYNNPTHFNQYATAMPVTMRMGFSSFGGPMMMGGMGMGMGVGMGWGMGGFYDPWWNPWMCWDPWNPWFRWHRWRMWGGFGMWHTWSPWGPYGHWGMGWGYGMGYGMGFQHGYWAGINAYNFNQGIWAGDGGGGTINSGPRPSLGGSSFNNSTGSAPGAAGFQGANRGGLDRAGQRPNSDQINRGGGIQRTPDGTRVPSQSPSRSDGFSRPAPSRGTPSHRTPPPSDGRNNSFFRGGGNRGGAPSTSPPRGGSRSPGISSPSPSRGGSPSMRPSSPSRSFGSPSRGGSSPRMSSPSPSRGGGSMGGGSRGGGGRR